MSSVAIVPAVVVIVIMLVIVVAVDVVTGSPGPAEVVLVHVSPDVASQIGAGLLIEAIMNPPVDARVADVVRDLAAKGRFAYLT